MFHEDLINKTNLIIEQNKQMVADTQKMIDKIGRLLIDKHTIN